MSLKAVLCKKSKANTLPGKDSLDLSIVEQKRIYKNYLELQASHRKNEAPEVEDEDEPPPQMILHPYTEILIPKNEATKNLPLPDANVDLPGSDDDGSPAIRTVTLNFTQKIDQGCGVEESEPDEGPHNVLLTQPALREPKTMLLGTHAKSLSEFVERRRAKVRPRYSTRQVDAEVSNMPQIGSSIITKSLTLTNPASNQKELQHKKFETETRNLTQGKVVAYLDPGDAHIHFSGAYKGTRLNSSKSPLSREQDTEGFVIGPAKAAGRPRKLQSAMRKKKKKPATIKDGKFESLKRPSRPQTCMELPDTTRIKQNYGLSSHRADSESVLPENFARPPSQMSRKNQSISPNKKATIQSEGLSLSEKMNALTTQIKDKYEKILVKTSEHKISYVNYANDEQRKAIQQSQRQICVTQSNKKSKLQPPRPNTTCHQTLQGAAIGSTRERPSPYYQFQSILESKQNKVVSQCHTVNQLADQDRRQVIMQDKLNYNLNDQYASGMSLKQWMRANSNQRNNSSARDLQRESSRQQQQERSNDNNSTLYHSLNLSPSTLNKKQPLSKQRLDMQIRQKSQFKMVTLDETGPDTIRPLTSQVLRKSIKKSYENIPTKVFRNPIKTSSGQCSPGSQSKRLPSSKAKIPVPFVKIKKSKILREVASGTPSPDPNLIQETSSGVQFSNSNIKVHNELATLVQKGSFKGTPTNDNHDIGHTLYQNTQANTAARKGSAHTASRTLLQRKASLEKQAMDSVAPSQNDYSNYCWKLDGSEGRMVKRSGLQGKHQLSRGQLKQQHSFANDNKLKFQVVGSQSAASLKTVFSLSRNEGKYDSFNIAHTFVNPSLAEAKPPRQLIANLQNAIDKQKLVTLKSQPSDPEQLKSLKERIQQVNFKNRYDKHPKMSRTVTRSHKKEQRSEYPRFNEHIEDKIQITNSYMQRMQQLKRYLQVHTSSSQGNEETL